MSKNRVKYLLIPVVAAVGIFFLLEKVNLPGLSNQSDRFEPFNILRGAISLIRDDYVEEPDPAKTMAGAYRGMIDSLDVLSSYLEPEAVTRFQMRADPGLKETGLILYKRYGRFPIILGIKEGSPAQKKGLVLGTSLSSVDDRSTLTMSMLELNLYLKSQDEGPVKIEIVQAAENQIVELERVQLSSASFSFTSTEAFGGILTIHHLNPPLVQAVRSQLLSRLQDQTAPIILDFRNCTEGTWEEALAFTNLFLQSANVGHFTKKRGEDEILACSQPADLADQELIIWVNQATLGPAEAVASILKSQKEAKIVGHKTLGLTARQKFIPFEDGSGVVLTTAIFRPSRSGELWLKGIEPDIKLKADAHDTEDFLQGTRKITPST